MSDTFNQYLDEQLNGFDFLAEYEALESEFSIIQAMIEAHKFAKAGVSTASPPDNSID